MAHSEVGNAPGDNGRATGRDIGRCSPFPIHTSNTQLYGAGKGSGDSPQKMDWTSERLGPEYPAGEDNVEVPESLAQDDKIFTHPWDLPCGRLPSPPCTGHRSRQALPLRMGTLQQAAAIIQHGGAPAAPPAPTAPAILPAPYSQKNTSLQDEEFAALYTDRAALTAEIMGALLHPLTGWSLEEAGMDIFG